MHHDQKIASIDVQNTETTTRRVLGFITDWNKLLNFLKNEWKCEKVFFYSGIDAGDSETEKEVDFLNIDNLKLKIKKDVLSLAKANKMSSDYPQQNNPNKNLILSAVLVIIIIVGGFFLLHNTQTTKNNLATSNMPNVVRSDLATVESANSENNSSQNNPLNPPYLKGELAEVSDSSSVENSDIGNSKLIENLKFKIKNSPSGSSPLGGDPLVKGGGEVN